MSQCMMLTKYTYYTPENPKQIDWLSAVNEVHELLMSNCCILHHCFEQWSSMTLVHHWIKVDPPPCIPNIKIYTIYIVYKVYIIEYTI